MLNTTFFNYTITNASVWQNSTNILEPPRWTYMAVIFLISFILSTLGNGTLLLVFIKDRTLHTPFNVYLINLLIANLSFTFLEYPFDIITNLYANKWFMGDGTCSLYAYAGNILIGVVMNSHQLIAINRIWAVTRPISYRTHHSIKTAALLCFATWVYVHVMVGPGWLLDLIYYRHRPVDVEGCTMNVGAQPTWHTIIQLVIFDLPKITMLLAFPIIHCTRLVRRRVVGIGKNSSVYATQAPAVSLGGMAHGSEDEQRPVAPSAGRPKNKSNGILVLALLTISAVICWSPIAIFYDLLTFMPGFNNLLLFQVGNILMLCQTFLDPILFAAALGTLRAALWRFFTCRR